jgi:hypothetical protein
MQHKVSLVCLAYTDTSDFCLDVEKTCVTYLDLQCFLANSVGSWNITEMVLNEQQLGLITPTSVILMGQNAHWEYVVNEDNTCYSSFDFECVGRNWCGWINPTRSFGLVVIQ